MLAEILPVVTSPRVPKRQEYLKVKITQVRTSYGNNWILNGMDSHVALERGALLFIMELPILNHFWEHVKYWSENKEINNFHSEIETQAYKSSSYIILMWKFMSSNIDCSCMSVAPGLKKTRMDDLGIQFLYRMFSEIRLSCPNLAQFLRLKLQCFIMEGTVARRSSIWIFSDGELQTCSYAARLKTHIP